MFCTVCGLHSNYLVLQWSSSPLWLSLLIIPLIISIVFPNFPHFYFSLQADTEKARSSSNSRSSSRHRRVCINTHFLFCLYFRFPLCFNPIDNLFYIFFHISPLTAGWWRHVSQQLQGAYFPASLIRLSSYWGMPLFVEDFGSWYKTNEGEIVVLFFSLSVCLILFWSQPHHQYVTLAVVPVPVEKMAWWVLWEHSVCVTFGN